MSTDTPLQQLGSPTSPSYSFIMRPTVLSSMQLIKPPSSLDSSSVSSQDLYNVFVDQLQIFRQEMDARSKSQSPSPHTLDDSASTSSSSSSLLPPTPIPRIVSVTPIHCGRHNRQQVPQVLVIMDGPYNTSYSSSRFSIELKLISSSLIQSRFITPIFHPNVMETGLIYPSILSCDDFHTDTILSTIQSLTNMLIHPILNIPIEDLLTAWSQHPPAGCHCSFESLLPCTWTHLINTKNQDEQMTYILDLRNKIRDQQLLDYYALEKQKVRIQLNYQPLFRQFFGINVEFNREWMDDRFIDAFSNGREYFINQFIDEEAKNIYSFPFFKMNFCKNMLSELIHYEGCKEFPNRPPNSMNHHGVILNHIGLEPLMTDLLRKWLAIISDWLFPNIAMNSLDHHHSFLVEYKVGQDVSLDMHVDDGEVTANISLFDGFDGGDLAFCGWNGSKNLRKHLYSYSHRVGRCVLHGSKHRHGALPIESGERYNLVIWCKSSEYRQRQMNEARDMKIDEDDDEEALDPVCVSVTHDDDAGLIAQKLKSNGIPGGVGVYSALRARNFHDGHCFMDVDDVHHLS